MSILRLENIKKSFGKTDVLKGVSFSVEKGDVVAILGASGSGKTTLLRCLNFLETPDSGAIYLDDKELYSIDKGRFYSQENSKFISDEEIRRKRLNFGLVFQNFNLFPQYNVVKNITIACELLAKEKIKANGEYNGCTTMKSAVEYINYNAHDLLKKVGLLGKEEAYPCQLSGGQQQRVAIARALALNPMILCFDEPTSALDPELTGEVLKAIESLKNENSTMIIVTHEIAFAKEIASKVIFMENGVIAEMGTPEQVIDNPQNQRTREFLMRFNG